MTKTADETLLLKLLSQQVVDQQFSPEQKRAALLCLMAGATQQIADLEIQGGDFVVKFEHPRVGVAVVEISRSSVRGTTGSMLDMAQSVIEQAAAIAASKTVHATSFENSDEYRQALAKRIQGFQLLSFRKNADPITWSVTGLGERSEAYSHEILAHDPDEADFQSRWQEYLTKKPDPVFVSEFHKAVSALHAMQVAEMVPKPIDLLHLVTAAMDLVSACKLSKPNALVSDLVSTDVFAALGTLLDRAMRINPGMVSEPDGCSGPSAATSPTGAPTIYLGERCPVIGDIEPSANIDSGRSIEENAAGSERDFPLAGEFSPSAEFSNGVPEVTDPSTGTSERTDGGETISHEEPDDEDDGTLESPIEIDIPAGP